MKKLLMSVFAVFAAITLQAQDPNPPHYQTQCPPYLPFASNLIAHYTFTGGSLNNLGTVGAPLNGTPFGGAIPTIDAGGNPNCAYEFNGTPGCYIQVPSHSSLDLNVSGPGATISIWYMPKENSAGKFELLLGRGSTFHCPDGFGDYSVALYDCRKPVGMMNSYSLWDMHLMSTQTCSQQIGTYLNDAWQNVVVVYRPVGGTLQPTDVYWNNIKVNTGGFCPPTWVNQFGNLFLGKDFKGRMDEVRVYNVPFTAADVAGLYNYGIMGCCQTNPQPCDIKDITWCGSLSNPYTFTFDVVTNPIGASVDWDFGDGTGLFSSTGGVPIAHTYPGPGTYTVCVYQYDNVGQICDKRCVEICIGNPIPPKPSGIVPINGKTDIIGDPYPNPTSDVLYIPLRSPNTKDEELNIRILSIEGAVVFEGKKLIKAGDQKTSVALPNVAAGNYILEVVGDTNKATKMFTKQ